MTLTEIEKRLEALESEVRELRAKFAAQGQPARSWLGTIGRFADDPTFEEAVRLGREYREQVNRESLEELDREEQARTNKPRKKPKARKSNARA